MAISNCPVRRTAFAFIALRGLYSLRRVAGAFFKGRRAAAIKPRYAAQHPGVVYYYVMPEHATLGQLSAPCAKLEAFLKLHPQLPTVRVETRDASLSPTGRLPFIDFNGESIADSQFAIEFLMHKLPAICGDGAAAGCVGEAGLPEGQMAKGVMLRRVLEDSARLSLYRYTIVDHPELLLHRFASAVPPCVPTAVVEFFLKRFRTTVITMLNLHGHGDLTDAQYQKEFLADIKTVEQLLSQSQFAVADMPTQYDATVYAWLKSGLLLSDVPRGFSPAVAYAAASPVFQAYLQRVDAAMVCVKG
jgi:hypothetical protein